MKELLRFFITAIISVVVAIIFMVSLYSLLGIPISF
jgi:hypothetical protein